MLLDRIARYLYARLGAGYIVAWSVLQLSAAVFVVAAIVLIISSYYDPSVSEVVLIIGGAGVFTMLGVSWALMMQRASFLHLMKWRADPDPSDEATLEAWDLATSLTTRSFRRNSLRVNAIAAVPSVVIIAAVLGLRWEAIFVLLLVCVPTAGYATVLNYSIAEFLMRPLIEEIAARLPERFVFRRTGLPIQKRLLISLPVFTATTAIIVAALITEGGGTDQLLLATAASIVVAIVLSGELTILLSYAITTPIAELRRALSRVQEGDYSVRVPVVSSDDLGELSDDFNQMAQGLAEREQIREAFGTYVDREVADLVLSGQFPAEGVEVEVSIMFCDVPGFTSYAEGAAAQEVVAALNEVFTRTVAVIDRHGGHVDKFLGDGVLAVFGAPEGFADHADRAVAAGLDILAEVNDGGPGLKLHVGINSGRVIAGSIGGSGRLNFSVIGDVVNVASRVESATRRTGDQMLITAATRELMKRPIPLSGRGSIELKGKTEPCDVYAPEPPAATRGQTASWTSSSDEPPGRDGIPAPRTPR